MKKAVIIVILLSLALSLLCACDKNPATAGTTADEEQTVPTAKTDAETVTEPDTAAITEPETAEDGEPERVTADFDPVPGKKYIAFIYVLFVSPNGFAGYGDFSDGLYVSYSGANSIFNVYDTAAIVFDGADYKVEDKTFPSPGMANDGYTTKQTVRNAVTVRRSDPDSGEPEYGEATYAKPIIYLYPEKDTICSVRLDLYGDITCSYPQYAENGWSDFTARPDGTLVFPDGREYYALYWEGKGAYTPDMSSGFCVKGGDTAKFLQSALPKLGLSEREANEFIIYWLPVMQDNAYNLISFQTSAYTDSAKLTVEPQPDTLIRVFMAYKPLDEAVEITPQALTAPIRSGFTVVEWGGGEIVE